MESGIFQATEPQRIYVRFGGKIKPAVFLYFDNTKSIDIIIGALEKLKEKLNNFKIENHVLRDDNESKED